MKRNVSGLERRAFLGLAAASVLLAAGGSLGCASSATPGEKKGSEPYSNLPPASPDTESQFLVDAAVNMETIDRYLGRSDVEYRDMRLIKDPADYESIGGNSELSVTIEGFKIVPYPYIGTLSELPVEGAYDGDRLFDVEWSGSGQVLAARPRYEESHQIVEELFPSDRPLLLMCGGAGYAFMMRQLLVFLGWDEKLLYNVGGAWDYAGYHPVNLVSYDSQGVPTYSLWRADMAYIDFSYYTPIE